MSEVIDTTYSELSTGTGPVIDNGTYSKLATPTGQVATYSELLNATRSKHEFESPSSNAPQSLLKKEGVSSTTSKKFPLIVAVTLVVIVAYLVLCSIAIIIALAMISELKAESDVVDKLPSQQIAPSNQTIMWNLLMNRLSTVENNTRNEFEMLSGNSPCYPASSCAALPPCNPSGYYWVRASNGSAVRVYCDMTRSCGGVTGGWMRVAELDMTDRSQQCPSGLRQQTDGNKRNMWYQILTRLVVLQSHLTPTHTILPGVWEDKSISVWFH